MYKYVFENGSAGVLLYTFEIVDHDLELEICVWFERMAMVASGHYQTAVAHSVSKQHGGESGSKHCVYFLHEIIEMESKDCS